MFQQEKINPDKLKRTRLLLGIGTGIGAVASLLLPWYAVSCWLFACSAVLFEAASFQARRQDADLNRAWKVAAPMLVFYCVSPALVRWQDGLLALPVVLVQVVLLYLTVTLAVTGLLRAGGRTGSRPPQAVVMFEYMAGLYALLRLAADAFPQFEQIAMVLSMILLCFGFVQLVLFLVKGEKKKDNTV